MAIAAFSAVEGSELGRACVDLAEATHVAHCGNKASTLAQLIGLGISVPAGYVITSPVFEHFLDVTGLREPIDSLTKKLVPDDLVSLNHTCTSIRAHILESRLPSDLSVELQRWWHEALFGDVVIVRSSAIGEDSAACSFAGQLDSVADVADAAGLERAVLECWASYWNERTFSYQHRLETRLAGLALIVQRQISGGVSGVLFTSAPAGIRRNESEMLIEYCHGPGSMLVAGDVNPGQVVVSRPKLTCQTLAEPEQMLPPRPTDVGRIWPDLTQIAVRLEQFFQYPVDIEWTTNSVGELAIVQSRPITTGRPKNEAKRVMWSNSNISENYPDPISPLLYSIATEAYRNYFYNLARKMGVPRDRLDGVSHPLRNIIGSHGARIYYNLSSIHEILGAVPFGEHLVEFFGNFVGARDRPSSATITSEVQDLSLARRVWDRGRMLVCTGLQLLLVERGVRRFERVVDDYAKYTRDSELSKCSLEELRERLLEFLDIRMRGWSDAGFADVSALISYGLLDRLLRRWWPDDLEASSLQNALLRGLHNLASSQPVHALWHLSNEIRNDTELSRLFATTAPEDILSVLEARRDESEAYARFLAKFEKFLEEWGFRCAGELMLTALGYDEDPTGLMAILKSALGSPEKSPELALQSQKQEREVKTKAVLRQLSLVCIVDWLPWPTAATVIGPTLAWTQRAIAYRERARLKQALLYRRLRGVVLRAGEELANRDIVGSREDIFFLEYGEIEALLSGRAMFSGSVHDLVRLRHSEHRKLCATSFPDVFETIDGEPVIAHTDGESEADGGQERLTGLSACGGKIVGRACVLEDVTGASRLQQDDVLVTRQTDPGWGPVFFLIGGLVVERGGMLSHGAILAREFGIPAVVGLRAATELIPTGKTITVDGDRGVVHVGR